jgi:hypothetical protein
MKLDDEEQEDIEQAEEDKECEKIRMIIRGSGGNCHQE